MLVYGFVFAIVLPLVCTIITVLVYLQREHYFIKFRDPYLLIFQNMGSTGTVFLLSCCIQHFTCALTYHLDCNQILLSNPKFLAVSHVYSTCYESLTYLQLYYLWDTCSALLLLDSPSSSERGDIAYVNTSPILRYIYYLKTFIFLFMFT